MNVLIISNYFSPQESVGAMRPNAICKYFAEEGDRVFVITTPKHGAAIHDEVGDGNISIYSISYFGVVKKSEVVDRGYVIYKRSYNSKFVFMLKNMHRNLRKKIFCNFLDPRSFWVSSAVKFGNYLIESFNIDLVISSSPAYPVHHVASRLKRRFPSVFWSADYRDLWSGNPFFIGSRFFKSLEIKVERGCLKYADSITTVSHALAEYLSILHAKQVTVYTNGFELKDIGENRGGVCKKQNNQKRLVYTGTYIDNLYDVRPLLQALEILAPHIGSDELQVIFIGDNEAVRHRLCEYPAAFPYIQLLEPVSRADALKAQSDADLLLFFGAQENGGQAIKGVVSGKVFEYIISNTEIMAIGTTSEMEVGEIITGLRAGKCYSNDSNLIAMRISDLIRNGKKKIHVNSILLSSFRRDILIKKMRQDLIRRMSI